MNNVWNNATGTTIINWTCTIIFFLRISSNMRRKQKWGVIEQLKSLVYIKISKKRSFTKCSWHQRHALWDLELEFIEFKTSDVTKNGALYKLFFNVIRNAKIIKTRQRDCMKTWHASYGAFFTWQPLILIDSYYCLAYWIEVFFLFSDIDYYHAKQIFIKSAVKDIIFRL